MSNTIGDVKGVSGTSTGHNGQPGAGGQKPTVSGNSNPGGYKPPRTEGNTDGHVPMPK